MRLAFARAGLWFFGAVAVILIIGNVQLKDTEALVATFVGGVLVAGFVFFYTWYNYEKDRR